MRPTPGEYQVQPSRGAWREVEGALACSQLPRGLTPPLSLQSLYPADPGGCTALSPDGSGAPRLEGE